MYRELVFLAGAMLVALCGCRSTPVDQIPDEPESLTLYSIDGTETWEGKTTGETINGCPVLGSVEISDSAERRKVMAAVKNAIRNPPDVKFACWRPRHVLRLATQGKTLDIVICFQCQSFRSYRAGKEDARLGGLISPDAAPLLNGILAKAGIPLVPRIGK